jgi:uncharacterized lipoprotein (TIGR02269 family)
MSKQLGLLTLLLGALLSSCAGPHHAGQDWERIPHGEGDECEEHDGCVTLVCGEEEALCGLYRCEDAGVLLARAGPPPPVAAAAPGARPQRNWGWPQVLPGDKEAVFLIRWSNHPPPPRLFSGPPSGPDWVRHHLFPQQEVLRDWFARSPRNINVHEMTMVLHSSVHKRIHRGERGGAWNEAWRAFARRNPGATQQECYEHLGKLIQEFHLMGPVIPYYYLR